VTALAGGVRLRILSLDDDAGNQSLIRAVLSRAADPTIRDAEVVEAMSVGEAWLILDRVAVDVILLDIHLPDGLGLDLAAELIRREASRPAILALTASVLPAEQQAALDAGCDAFLAKPFAALDLVSAIRRLLDQRASGPTKGAPVAAANP
jgi:two-component system KDP operon response regulator KdpE